MWKSREGKTDFSPVSLEQDDDEDIKAFVETYRKEFSRQGFTRREGENRLAASCLWTVIPSFQTLHCSCPQSEMMI